MRQALLICATLAAMLFHAQLMSGQGVQAGHDVMTGANAPMMECCETAQTGHGAPACAAFFTATAQALPTGKHTLLRNVYVIEHWHGVGVSPVPPREPPRAV
ncbi:hypothetical protein DZK27_01365 [Rhodobacteraceae bacterium 63075]|nr:hypothetical protein DZK27_01365 [Rhodobacteraceae bacterium 63075]